MYGAYDKDGDGVADQTVTLLSGLNQPNGIAWHKGSLFVAEVTRVTRYDNADASVIANKVRTAVACSRSFLFSVSSFLLLTLTTSVRVRLTTEAPADHQQI